MNDRLKEMWDEQESFVDLLIEHRSFPNKPVSLETKSGQKMIKGLGHDCMHELFEALTLLRNSKEHRQTEDTNFDKDAFLEECVDAHKFFLELLIYAGISVDEFYDAYVKKSKIVKDRLKNGY